MNKNSKIYIAGHNGLAGSAIHRLLVKNGYSNIIFKNSTELDLRNQEKVMSFFNDERPEYVFFAAGTVGGIMANKTYPADFIFDNVTMFFNTINSSYKSNVKKLLYLGSSCIYPRDSPQPIKEEYLLSNYLEESNKPYAISKIAGIELCKSFNQQYNTNYISLMPTNLFGINDNYDLNNSHLVAALIRKIHEAKILNKEEVILWGTGLPRREILISDQLANACLYFMENYNGNDIINIGRGVDFTIKEIANMIKEVVKFNGKIIFDDSKPDGTMQKKLDVSNANNLGWQASGILLEELNIAYNDFVLNYNKYIN